MAVGTVSGVETQDNWQLITSTTASGSAVTFNSISGYSRLMVVWKAVTSGSPIWLYLKVNNDTTAGNYASTATYSNTNNNESTQLLILNGNNDYSHSGMIVIENANKSTPHQVSDFAAYKTSQWTQVILNSDPITRVDLTPSTSTFSGGTVQLWGIAG